MSGRLFLGLDVGTQGTKGLVLDADTGAIVARAARSYDLIEGLPPGAAEQDPNTWIDAVSAVSRELFAQVDGAALGGVGVSGQQHGCVLLDAAGHVVRPAKLWCDTATAAEARELSEQLGRHVPAGFTASKVRWVAQREPDNWARTRWVLLPHDYVNTRLTGVHKTEAGDASGTGYFEPRTRKYDAAALATVDPALPERVPALVGAGEPVGELTAEGAALLGLPPAAVGVPVAAGGGDNMMSAIGSGATRDGVAVCSLGTSATVFAHASEPVLDPDGLIAPFCDSTGGWLPLLCVMNATGVTEEVCAAFAAGHDELTSLAERVPAGCDGLLFAPYLVGERVPDLPQATGLLAGLRPGTLRAGVLYRAALEGVALNLAWGIERMRALGLRVESVRLVGGGARNPLWRSVLASAFDAPVERLEEPESGALGAALQAVWTTEASSAAPRSADEIASAHVRASGERTLPDAAAAATYRESLAAFKALIQRNF